MRVLLAELVDPAARARRARSGVSSWSNGARAFRPVVFEESDDGISHAGPAWPMTPSQRQRL
jgi:hypothetical protein